MLKFVQRVNGKKQTQTAKIQLKPAFAIKTIKNETYFAFIRGGDLLFDR